MGNETLFFSSNEYEMVKKERFVSLPVSKVSPSSERIKESQVVSYLWSRDIEDLCHWWHHGGVNTRINKLKEKRSFRRH